MTDELEKKLYDKYPLIFRQKSLSMQETCMCWGICVGDGWYDIIDNLCEKIQNYVDETGCEQIEAEQVKEKFGGLRFYINFGNDKVYEYINEAEELAENTCEICGTTENIGYTKGWITTCCKNCVKRNITEWVPKVDKKNTI